MTLPNQILVTGAAGWLGSRLVESLVNGLAGDDRFPKSDSGRRIRCFVLPTDDTAFLKKLGPNVEIITGDVRNAADSVRFCDGVQGAALIHIAGIIHPRCVREFYEINSTGTEKLLDAAIGAGVARVIAVSSNSPCGFNPHSDHLFDESSPYHPYLNYGRSKMKMELAVKARAPQIEGVIVRAPWFYGPHQPPRQTLFFQMIRDGKAPIVGGGTCLRSMAYVDNLCQGLLLAAATEKAKGEIYWIADERPYSMNEVIDTVERLLETEFGQKCAHKRLRLPGLASGVARVADAALQSLGLYHQKIHVLGEMDQSIACSVEKAKKELGFRPTVALEEGMRRSLQWCRDQGITL